MSKKVSLVELDDNASTEYVRDARVTALSFAISINNGSKSFPLVNIDAIPKREINVDEMISIIKETNCIPIITIEEDSTTKVLNIADRLYSWLLIRNAPLE